MARWGEVQWALGGGALPSEKLGLGIRVRETPEVQLIARCTVQHKVRSPQDEVSSAGIRNRERKRWTRSLRHRDASPVGRHLSGIQREAPLCPPELGPMVQFNSYLPYFFNELR